MIERLVLAIIDAVILTSALAMPLDLVFAPAGMGLFIAGISLLIVTLVISPFLDLALSALAVRPPTGDAAVGRG